MLEERQAEDRQRLDVWVAGHVGLSRSAAQALIDAGRVTVNGRSGRPGHRVGADDEVTVSAAPAVAKTTSPTPGDRRGPAVDLDIVYEDEWLAVIDKPAGLVVHPAPGHPAGTVADGLRQRGDTWSLLGGEERAGIVHRLDRDTSGLLVVARSETAHRSLSAQLRERTLGRTYWALVWGGFREQEGTVDAPIGRDRRNRLRMTVVDGGREAITDFTVCERFGDVSRLEVRLRTGRTHQIRVHLGYIGHPIVGDPLYGRRHDPHAGRPALHAQRLSFLHPADGRPMSFESALPDDLRALLETIAVGSARSA